MSNLDNWQERLQSPVSTYNVNKPMGREEFLQMPQDLQREYLQTLRVKYGFGTKLAARMFGVRKGVFCLWAETLRVPWPSALLDKRTTTYVSAREEFLKGYVFPEDAAAPAGGTHPLRGKASPTDKEASAGGTHPLRGKASPTGEEAFAEEAAPFQAADYGYIRLEMHGSLEGVIARLLENAELLAGVKIKCTVETWPPHE